MEALLKRFAKPYIMCTLIVSGILVILIQCLTLPLWYISRELFRRANAVIVQLSWLQMVWLVEWWAGFKITYHFDEPQVPDIIKYERSICLATHGSDVDWLLGWVAGAKFSILGSLKCLLKKELSKIPILGASWWFLEYTYISRNWEKDQSVLQKTLDNLAHFEFPWWLTIYAEGTRFTSNLHAQAVEYAQKKGWPEPKHVLNPKTKGFTTALQNLRPHLQSIILYTLAFPEKRPNILHLLNGVPLQVEARMTRIPIEEVPETEEEAAEWCREQYRKMDKFIDEFVVTKDYHDDHVMKPSRMILPLIVFTSWAVLLALVSAYSIYLAITSASYLPLIIVVIIFGIGEVITRAGLALSKKKEKVKKN